MLTVSLLDLPPNLTFAARCGAPSNRALRHYSLLRLGGAFRQAVLHVRERGATTLLDELVSEAEG